MNILTPPQMYKSISKPESTDHIMKVKSAKELIKLANSYKVPGLNFDVKASKLCISFTTCITKMQTILSVFPQTASVIQNNSMIHFYENSKTFGNKALFLLIGAKVDTYFQRAIHHFNRHVDKALAFMQTQCANSSNEDKDY